MLTKTYQGVQAAFYEAGNTTAGVPGEFQVAIAGHPYVIEPALYSRQTVDMMRPFSDGGSDVGENSLNPQALWRRAATDWSLGANQAYFDDPQTSDRRRYFTSYGLDTLTIPRQVSLLADTARASLPVGPSTIVGMLVAGNKVWWWDNVKNVGYFTFPTQAGVSVVPTPSTTNQWGSGNVFFSGAFPVAAATSDGARFYAAEVGTVFVCDMVNSPTTFTTLYSGGLQFTVLGYANGRLLGGVGASLYEITAAGATTLVMTHTNPSFKWSGIVGAPSGTYAWGNIGNAAEIYVIGVVDATGQLAAPVYAGSVDFGETVNGMAYYGGLMVLGTSAGLRLATLASTGGLTVGPVVNIIGGVKVLAVVDRFCYFGAGSGAGAYGAGVNIWKADLSRFVSPMVPAISTDLACPGTTAGTGKNLVTGLGVLTGVYGPTDLQASHPEVPAATPVFLCTGYGIACKYGTYVGSGTMDSGIIRFGAIDPKIVSFIDVRHDPLAAGCSVSAAATIDNGSVVTGGTSSRVGTSGPPEPWSLNNVSSETIHVQVTLTTTNTANTPVTRRWLLKGLPTPIPVETIRVPIILKDYVRTIDSEGTAVPFDPYAETAFLRNLIRTRQVVNYQEGQQVIPVYVESVEWKMTGWNATRSSPEGYLTAQLKTLG